MAITVNHGLDPLLFGPVAAFGQAGPRLEQGVIQQTQLDNQLFGQAMNQRQFANQVRQAEMERAQRGALAYLQLASGNANQERDRQMRVGMAQQQMGFEAGSKQFDAANQNYRQNQLFEQQTELEGMRQFGLDSRLGRQVASRELVARNANDTRMELQNQRLSASEMQRVNILRADIAELDRQFHEGAFTGPDGQQRYETARQNRVLELGGFERRIANSTQMERRQQAENTQEGWRNRMMQMPDGSPLLHPESGSPMMLNHQGNPIEMFPGSSSAWRPADTTRMMHEAITALTTETTDANTGVRSRNLPSQQQIIDYVRLAQQTHQALLQPRTPPEDSGQNQHGPPTHDQQAVQAQQIQQQQQAAQQQQQAAQRQYEQELRAALNVPREQRAEHLRGEGTHPLFSLRHHNEFAEMQERAQSYNGNQMPLRPGMDYQMARVEIRTTVDQLRQIMRRYGSDQRGWSDRTREDVGRLLLILQPYAQARVI